MNVFLMQNSIVRPLGRDMQNVLIGFVGEHEARTFFVRTRDDLSGYTVGLVIGDIDCGAMTKAPMPDGSIMLSLTLTSDMLGKGGDKVCQLLMTKDAIVRKSSQFRAYVGASNDINSTAPDSATIIIISEKITELVHEAALDAIAEVQEVIGSIPADYSELSAQVDQNTEDIGGLKADLGAQNIKEKRSDFLINKYWMTQNKPVADMDGWICTSKYAVQSRKKYTLVHDLENPIKEIYAIVYDGDGTYITYLKLQNINSISVDALLNGAENARYIAFDFNLTNQLPVVAESDIANWYLLVEDNQVDLLKTTVMNGAVRTATVVGSSVVSANVTWGFKVVKPLSLFAWKQQGLTAKTMTVNIYKQTNQQSSYNQSGSRNDYIVKTETRILQSTDYIILTNVESGTYIEVVSTAREIKYAAPDVSSQKISFGYLEIGNFTTIDGNLVYHTNENTFASSFLSGDYIIIPQNRVSSVLANANIACIGDSITEYNSRAYVNWVMYLEKWTGCNIQNLGQSGRGFVNDYAGTSYIDKIALITGTPDIIGVACSFNDVYTGKGNDFDWSTENGRSAGKVYIDEFWDALITAFPTVPVICYCEGPWENARPGIAKSDGYIETVRQSCYDHGIPFYDNLYYGCALRPWLQANREEYFTSDNIKTGNTGVVDNTHPNSKGHKFIARYLVDKFSQNMYADGLNYS